MPLEPEEWCSECERDVGCVCEDCWCHVCEYCFNCCGCNRDENEPYVRKFYTPSSRYYRLRYEPAPRLYFGIENEMELNWDYRNQAVNYAHEFKDDEFYRTTSDGSLSEQGIEIITRPFTFDWIKKYPHRLEKLFNMAKFYKADDDHRCGMHISMSRRYFTKLEEYKVYRLVTSDMAGIISGRDVPFSNYCRKDDYYNPGRFFYKNRKDKRNNDKFCALGMSTNSRLEVRIFQGTTKRDILYKNLQFCHAVATFAKQSSVADGTKELTNYIISNDNQYPQLINYMKEKELL
jgi:hypothetical protein